MIQPELHKAFEITFDQSSKQNEKGGRTILNSAGSTISSPMFTWADQMGETTGSRVEKHKFLIPRLLSFTMVSFSTQCWLGFCFWIIGNHHWVQTCKVALFQSDIYFHVNVKYVSMNEPLQQAKINEIMMSQALFFSSHIFEIIAFSYYTTDFKTHQW